MQYNLQNSLLTNLEIRSKKRNFKKPNSWPNICKNAKENSIRLLTDNRYPLGFTATCSGGYSVDIDGKHYADYASEEQFSMAAANWPDDRELPVGYKRLLGISMNNNCYYQITNFKLKGNDTLRFSFSITTSGVNVIGCFNGSNADNNYSLYSTSGTSAAYLRYNGGSYNSQTLLNKRYNVAITPTGSIGFENESTWSEQNFTSTVDLYIGTTSLTGTSSKLQGSLYGNIEIDGRLKLIPCERESDETIGYYDTYSQTFYTPAEGSSPESLGYDTSHKIGYDINYPTGASKAHIIDIYPSSESNNITAFRCQRVAASGTEEQGVLWAHLNITNAVNLSKGFAYTEYYNDLLTAVTAKNNRIMSNGLDYCFYNALSIEYLPKIDYSNISDMTNFITNAKDINKTNVDVSANTTLTKIGIYGDSSHFMEGFKGLRVSNYAPFNDATNPQINISYTGINKAAIVQIFQDLPTVSDGQSIDITGCTGTADLTANDETIATDKGWTIIK